jgi:hypothetical protein
LAFLLRLLVSVDATMSDGIARYCNDEVEMPNARVKKIVTEKIHLCLFALRDVHVGDEIRYDYGPDVGNNMPWRKIKGKGQQLAPFLKVEDEQRRYRPSLIKWESFPNINVAGDISDGIFEKLVAAPFANKRQFGKPKKVRAEASRRPGFCECCDTEYTDMNKHCQTVQHKTFVQTNANYQKVDDAISDLPSIHSLLKRPSSIIPVGSFYHRRGTQPAAVDVVDDNAHANISKSNKPDDVDQYSDGHFDDAADLAVNEENGENEPSESEDEVANVGGDELAEFEVFEKHTNVNVDVPAKIKVQRTVCDGEPAAVDKVDDDAHAGINESNKLDVVNKCSDGHFDGTAVSGLTEQDGENELSEFEDGVANVGGVELAELKVIEKHTNVNVDVPAIIKEQSAVSDGEPAAVDEVDDDAPANISESAKLDVVNKCSDGHFDDQADSGVNDQNGENEPSESEGEAACVGGDELTELEVCEKHTNANVDVPAKMKVQRTVCDGEPAAVDEVDDDAHASINESNKLDVVNKCSDGHFDGTAVSGLTGQDGENEPSESEDGVANVGGVELAKLKVCEKHTNANVDVPAKMKVQRTVCDGEPAAVDEVDDDAPANISESAKLDVVNKYSEGHFDGTSHTGVQDQNILAGYGVVICDKRCLVDYSDSCVSI